MILAFDTHYRGQSAKTVCVSFLSWSDDEPQNIYSETVEGIAEYEPGAFFKRELPCILSLLKKIPSDSVNCIVIDGFVLLDDSGKLGLGGHLYNSLDKKVPVIGVAKSSFLSNTKNVMELRRGVSKNPLYISAIGVELVEAHNMVSTMAGSYRLPKLLKLLDTKTKEK